MDQIWQSNWTRIKTGHVIYEYQLNSLINLILKYSIKETQMVCLVPTFHENHTKILAHFSHKLRIGMFR